MTINLSDSQTYAYDRIMHWFENTDEQIFTLAGYAGTGKTTIAKHIAEKMEGVHFCAFTGKAANVLREKGCKGTTTIHGAIYKLEEDNPKDPKFVFEPQSFFMNASLIVVDEYSMLNEELLQDLHATGKRILYMGDNFQLPPVQGKNILNPDHQLEEIHRQALDSPIIRYATKVREGEQFSYVDDGDFKFLPKSKVPKEAFFEAEQLIVGYNKTRAKWNQAYREEKGFIEDWPEEGEKLICLRNNHRKGLFNGMIGYCTSEAKDVGRERWSIGFDQWEDLTIWDGDILGRTTYPPRDRNVDRFDFAYAITCHKSQGSEFEDIIIQNEPVGRSLEDKRKWLYTAITRAKQRCTLVAPYK